VTRRRAQPFETFIKPTESRRPNTFFNGSRSFEKNQIFPVPKGAMTCVEYRHVNGRAKKYSRNRRRFGFKTYHRAIRDLHVATNTWSAHGRARRRRCIFNTRRGIVRTSVIFRYFLLLVRERPSIVPLPNHSYVAR